MRCPHGLRPPAHIYLPGEARVYYPEGTDWSPTPEVRADHPLEMQARSYTRQLWSRD